MKLAIGSDHAGLQLKDFIKENLSESFDVRDLGTDSPESVDYPVFGRKVAEIVARGEVDRGILVCGTGIGMAITANKVPGIRAAVIHDTFSARASVEHNNLNVLCLGGRVIGPELGLAVVRAYLGADFAGGRHARRLALIEELEKKNRALS